jgi:Carboxypeptidase regulatory-like domain
MAAKGTKLWWIRVTAIANYACARSKRLPGLTPALLLLVLTVLILTAPGTRAQVLYGSLSGVVTDATGAAIPNANVQAFESQKGIRQQTTTDASGLYRFSEMLSGTWNVTVSAPGFNPAETDNVRVDASAVARVDEKLAIGTVQQNVTVTTAPPLLQTDRADVHTVISTEELQALPSISSEGKSFQELYRIIPGASLPQENNSAAGNPSRAMTSNFNGQSSQGNDTRIDGILDAYPWLPNNVAYVPPSDSIETVNIATNSFDAEQGMVNGAAVNVQIKTGTNQFHGDVHEYHTDDFLHNQNYFNPPGFKKPLNIFNQYGGAVGGPIKKDKLFFFGDWESTRQTLAPSGGNPQTVPFGGLQYGTAATNGFFDFRGLAVDKSGNPVHVYDPRTGNANGSGRTPISCNGVVDELCLGDVDPAALTMAKLIPAPNQSGSTNNYLDTQKGFFHRDNYDAKVNYVRSQQSTIFGRFSFSNGDIFDPPSLGAAGGNATNGGQNGNAFTHIWIIGVGGTHTFSPTILLDGNVGFTRQHLSAENIDIATDKAFGLDTLHIPGTNNALDPSNQLYWGIPAFQFNTFANLGNANTGNPFVFRDNQYVANGNLTWIKGNHQFRFGGEWDHTQLNHFQPQGGTFQTARGSFDATGAATEQATCASATTLTGCSATDPPTTLQYNSYADFLLGLEDQTGKAVQDTDPIALRWAQWAVYARDLWQFTPKLSLNYGLRWEYYPMAYSDHGKGARVLDPATMQVLIGGNGSVPRNDGVQVGAGSFLPRIGIAYQAHPNTVVRAGFGISADSNNWRFLRNAYPADTISSWTGQATGTSINFDQFAPADSLTGLNATGPYASLPAGIVLIPEPNTSSGSIPLPNGISTTTIEYPKFRRGYIYSFNATVQQEFAGFVWNLGYVGSREIRPLLNMNINAAPGGGGAAGQQLNAEFGGNWSAINQLIPKANNYYDSLQAKLTRRLGQSSTVGVVYTWSKSIDLEDDEEINSILWPYPTYFSRNKAVAGFDRTNNFETYWLYQLPFGKGQRWATHGVASAIAGGWTFSGVLSALSGTPFTVTDSGAGTSNLNAPGNTQTVNIAAPIDITHGRPDQNPSNCALGNTSCSYFNPASFARVTTPATLGDAGRDIIRGPGYFDLDGSLFRNFKITERITFQFEADAFSLTNTPHFGNPTSDFNNANFGKVTSTLAVSNASLGGSGGERQWWFGGKIIF